jgi:hypothetical protein
MGKRGRRKIGGNAARVRSSCSPILLHFCEFS